jgi:hypothetical protein
MTTNPTPLNRSQYLQKHQEFSDQLQEQTNKYTAAKKTVQKQGTYHDPNQQSIFDVLKPEDWGDAKPYEKSPDLAKLLQQHKALEARLEALEAAERERQKQEADARTCPWCGHEADSKGNLALHEEDCAPDA